MRAAARRPPAEDSALADLRARVAALEAAWSKVCNTNLAQHDPEQDAALLSALAACFGSRVFSVSDLRQSSNPELRALVAGMRPRMVGRWLRRLHVRAPAPYTVQRIGRDAAGCQWCVDLDRLHSRG